jgi:hypothetical protein
MSDLTARFKNAIKLLIHAKPPFRLESPPVQHLSPAYFALVMSTGIVSIAAWVLQPAPAVALAGLAYDTFKVAAFWSLLAQNGHAVVTRRCAPFGGKADFAVNGHHFRF